MTELKIDDRNKHSIYISHERPPPRENSLFMPRRRGSTPPVNGQMEEEEEMGEQVENEIIEGESDYALSESDDAEGIVDTLLARYTI